MFSPSTWILLNNFCNSQSPNKIWFSGEQLIKFLSPCLFLSLTINQVANIVQEAHFPPCCKAAWTIYLPRDFLTIITHCTSWSARLSLQTRLQDFPKQGDAFKHIRNISVQNSQKQFISLTCFLPLHSPDKKKGNGKYKLKNSCAVNFCDRKLT